MVKKIVDRLHNRIVWEGIFLGKGEGYVGEFSTIGWIYSYWK